MADVTHIDSGATPDRLFERKHHSHDVDVRRERCRAPGPPRPNLRGAVPENAHAGGAQMRGKARVEVAVVDEESRARSPAIYGSVHRSPCPENPDRSSRCRSNAERRRCSQVAHQIDAATGQSFTAQPERIYVRQAFDDAGRRSVCLLYTSRCV